MARQLVINADDLGIHPDTDAGILRAYREGVLSSATLLTTTPWCADAARMAREAGLPIGIHLSLTLGQSRAAAGSVPDLVDDTGMLHRGAADFLLMRAAKGDVPALLAQIRTEFEAQLAAAADCGVRPTHCDSHQHVHMHPAIYALVEDLAQRFGIGRLRFSRERLYAFEFGRDLVDAAARNNHVKWLLLSLLARRIERRLPTPDEFYGVKASGVLTERGLLGIARRSQAGLLEIGVHPGLKVAPDATGYRRKGYVAFVSSPWRQRECDLLTDRCVADTLRGLGLVLCGFDGRPKE